MEAALAIVGLIAAGLAAGLAAWGMHKKCKSAFMRPFSREVKYICDELAAMLIVVPRRYIVIVLVVSIVSGVGIAAVASGFMMIVSVPIGVIMGLRMPRVIVHIARNRTRCRIADQMVDMLSLLSNALSAGMSLQQSCELASHELSNPMGRELAAVVSSVKIGRIIEDALVDWEKRWELEDLAILASSVTVLKKTGGNLIETFSTLARTIRERKKVEGRIRVLTSQGLIQGITLIAMPFLLGLALYVVSPDYIEPLFVTEPGKKMLMVGLAMQALGGWWIIKTVCIKV